MKRIVVTSWLLLFYFDCLMHLCSFQRALAAVRSEKCRLESAPIYASAKLCLAIDLACIFYFKRVQCLQRSAATTMLLRRQGWNAEMVLGVQLMPFQSHAWVEVDGEVVNDRPYITEIFEVMDRC